MTEFNKKLDAIGLYKVEKNMTLLYSLTDKMVELAGTDSKEPKFEALNSYIPAQANTKTSTMKLIIDIGGTTTKVGLNSSNQAEWLILLENKHVVFKDENIKADSLSAYALKVSEKVVEKLNQLKIPINEINECAVVWSNALESIKLDGLGISGVVVQREMYRKGEWFMADLENGTELGEKFINAFKESGINIKKFLIANDTPLTMKALTNSHSGMVASTGLNATVVKKLSEISNSTSAESVICNAEMGGRFFIADDLIAEGDKIAFPNEPITIETLSAGGFLGQIFIGSIKALINRNESDLKPFYEQITNNNFELKTEDLTAMIANIDQWKERRAVKINSTEEENKIIELAKAIFMRSAKLCALVAYGSVANQLGECNELIVALDSRLGREVPIFLETFNEQLNNFPRKSNSSKIKAVLVQPVRLPNGKISIPMQGAAIALASI
jgi:hexokinase